MYSWSEYQHVFRVVPDTYTATLEVVCEINFDKTLLTARSKLCNCTCP
jgi:hypothetical protein